MSIPREQRTGKNQACPICGHHNWCFFVDAEKTTVWCGRESRGSFRTGEKEGWLHRVADKPRDLLTRSPASKPVIKPAHEKYDLARAAHDFEKAVDPSMAAHVAGWLGLNVGSLRKLRLGWARSRQIWELGTPCKGPGCWTFPMVDGDNRVVGFGLRTPATSEHPEGFKYRISDSDGSGLFVPRGLKRGMQLLVPEGPTSLAAFMVMRLAGIGRPNCRAGVSYLRQWIQRLEPNQIVIVGDNDVPDKRGRRAGQESAPIVAAAIADLCLDTRVLIPPDGIKDGRQWLQARGDAVNVQLAIDSSWRKWRNAG